MNALIHKLSVIQLLVGLLLDAPCLASSAKGVYSSYAGSRSMLQATTAVPSNDTSAPSPLSTDNCPKASGVSCLALTATSDPTSIYDLVPVISLDLANQVYKSPNQLLSYAKTVLGATDAKFITNNATDTQAVVVGGDTAIFVAFRGTESSTDADTDAALALTETQFGDAGSAKVHGGFLRAVDSIYTNLTSILVSLNPKKDHKVYFTGHSLGSALAMLAAAKVQADLSLGQTVAGVYSFGGPRVGDSNWAKLYNTLGLESNTIRVSYYKDPVPMLPTVEMGFEHVGRPFILPSDASECVESVNIDEYDVCRTDDAKFDFKYGLGPELSCGDLASVLLGSVCQSVGQDATQGIASDIVSQVCDFASGDILSGNLCCTILEGVLIGADQILKWHDGGAYMAALTKGCSNTCTMQLYDQCGSGSSKKFGQQLSSKTLLNDPVADLTPESAQAVYDITALFGFGNGTSETNSGGDVVWEDLPVVVAPAPAPAVESNAAKSRIKNVLVLGFIGLLVIL